MSNPNPKTEQLALGRGKRPKLNHESVSMRMSAETRNALEQIAQSYDCLYANKPWIAGLLEKIGSGELAVVPAPPYSLATKSPIEPNQVMRDRMIEKNLPQSPR